MKDYLISSVVGIAIAVPWHFMIAGDPPHMLPVRLAFTVVIQILVLWVMKRLRLFALSS
jgi:hypothetical protein